MRLTQTRRAIGIAVVAIGVGVGSLTTALPVDTAQAATLASVSQQGDGGQQSQGGQQAAGGQQGDGGQGGGQQAAATPLDQYNARVARIDSLVQSGDCATARSEVRSLLSDSPETLFRSDVTMQQMRDLRIRMDEAFYRTATRC
jgi:hypothetical protein